MEKKFCINCKWTRPSPNMSTSMDKEHNRCGHPSLVSLVTGEPILHCSTERKGESDGKIYPCGNEGRLFEPKDQPQQSATA